MRLTTATLARFGLPSGNCLIREPDGETSPLTKTVIVLGPVCHSVPLLGDAVAASGIGFERHGRNLWSEAEQASTLPSCGYQLAHPCSKAQFERLVG
jgi:hypothetical protein